MTARTTIDLLQGTLAVMILKGLSWGPMHGYSLAKWIEQTSYENLLVEEGSLYPALHRLEAHGWVSSEWQISPTNRRVKTYTITGAGRQQLRAELARWDRFSAAVERVLKARKPRTA